MATRKITRKVIKPVGGVKPVQVKTKPEVLKAKEVEEVLVESQESSTKQTKTKKGCTFCQNKSIPSYTDLAVLRRFLTDRAKIVNRERSGVCSKHQRQVAKNIKWARHLSLLPFVPKV